MPRIAANPALKNITPTNAPLAKNYTTPQPKPIGAVTTTKPKFHRTKDYATKRTTSNSNNTGKPDYLTESKIMTATNSNESLNNNFNPRDYIWNKSIIGDGRVGYIRITGNRNESGAISIEIVFSKEAISDLHLEVGERYLIGISEKKQSIAIQKTFYGGILLSNAARSDERASRARLRFTLRIGGMPPRQDISSDQTKTVDHFTAEIPFVFRLSSEIITPKKIFEETTQ